MKKLLKYILLTIVLATTLTVTTANAQNNKEKQFFPSYLPEISTLPGPSPTEVKDKTAKNILTNQILPRFAVGLIGFVGGIALVFIIIGGVRFTMMYGNDEDIEKARNQIIYGIIGFLVSLLAYTIISAVVNLKFEGEGTGKINFRFPSIMETAYAAKAKPAPCKKTSDCGEGKICVLNYCQSQLDALTPTAQDDFFPLDNPILDSKELEQVENLPKVTLESALTTGVKTILGWSMLLTLIALVWASIYYMISLGNEEDIGKAKNIILYLIIGVAIMAASYGVISGIAQFDFFTMGGNTAYAYTIPDEYSPINLPFQSLNQNLDKGGAAVGTIILLQLIAGGLLFFAAPIAVIMLAMAGFAIVTGGADTEKVEEGKKNITWALAGLGLIILSYSIVRAVLNIVLNAANT